VDELVKAMRMRGIAKSRVSRICAGLDKQVHAFLGSADRRPRVALFVDCEGTRGREDLLVAAAEIPVDAPVVRMVR